MIKIFKYVLLSSLFLFITDDFDSCPSSQDEKIVLSIDYQVYNQLNTYKELEGLKNFLEEYFNAESYEEIKSFWIIKDTDKISYQHDIVNKNLQKHYPYYKPTLYAIEKLKKNDFLLKISLIGDPEGFNSILASHNLRVRYTEDNCYKLVNIPNQKLKKMNKFSYGNVTFYTSNKELDHDDISKHVQFEQKLADIFEVELENYSIVKFKNTKELYNFLGFDYHDAMYLNESYGGMYIPYDKILLNGNNSVFYPHELTHLYSSKKIKVKNNLIDEGFATFIGGSLGFDYTYHIKNLQKYFTSKNDHLMDFILEQELYNKLIGKSSTVKYSVGSFLCHVIYKHKNREGVMSLLETGKSPADLINNLKNLLNLNENDLENFLERELRKFSKGYDILS